MIPYSERYKYHPWPPIAPEDEGVPNHTKLHGSISPGVAGYSELKNLINELQESKMDKTFEYNEEENSIQFFVNGEPIGEKIYLDNEVHWEGWNS